MKSQLRKKLGNLKKNLQSLAESREQVIYSEKTLEKKTIEIEKIKKSNGLFEKIKGDLDQEKTQKIKKYEEYYKQAQQISKGCL